MLKSEKHGNPHFYKMQNLNKYFQKANLPLEVTYKPFARGVNSKEIFQMTIEGKKHEQFKIFPGVGTDVRVLDTDKKRRQVLLFVHEPKRKFIEKLYDAEARKVIDHERETSPEIRRYLAGMDESHLFISELPSGQGKINTIEDAHKRLKPTEVKDRKKRKGIKPARQGEWFFVDATTEELIEIKEKEKGVIYKTSLPRRGKPHVVDMMLVIDDKTFIKGKVKHSDHKTQEFKTWQRVFRNTEVVNQGFHGWID